jgi:hypothetical protein
VPTLVLHRSGDRDVPVEGGRDVADRIAGARFVELPGIDSFPWAGDQEPLLAEIEAFVTGSRATEDGHRVLATVLFTDIVGSTARAAELGDARWKELLAVHDEKAKAEIDRFRGRWRARAERRSGHLAPVSGGELTSATHRSEEELKQHLVRDGHAIGGLGVLRLRQIHGAILVNRHPEGNLGWMRVSTDRWGVPDLREQVRQHPFKQRISEAGPPNG